MDVTIRELNERRLENLREWLEELKTELKTATSPGVRQLIHEDIAGVLDQIKRVEAKLSKE